MGSARAGTAASVFPRDWHAVDLGWIINSRATLVGGYGILGTLANSTANNAWWLQVKYEF